MTSIQIVNEWKVDDVTSVGLHVGSDSEVNVLAGTSSGVYKYLPKVTISIHFCGRGRGKLRFADSCFLPTGRQC